MATVTPPRNTSTRFRDFFRRGDPTERRLVGPIRGEVLGADRLAKHARNIARKHRLLPPKKQRGPGPLLLRLDDSRKVLDEVHDRLELESEKTGERWCRQLAFADRPQVIDTAHAASGANSGSRVQPRYVSRSIHEESKIPSFRRRALDGNR